MMASSSRGDPGMARVPVRPVSDDPPARLSAFRLLSFDCYGTLIDWERGIWTALQPLAARASCAALREAALAAFARHETAVQQAWPETRYPDVLAEVHRRLAAEWGVTADPELDRAFGASVPSWPVFPDTAAALRILGSFVPLAVLSNVDQASFAATARRLGVRFDAVYTAEQIGCFKPHPAAFRYLLRRAREDFGTGPGEILHVAQSLYHDHVPAAAAGLASAWIDRRGGQGGATARVTAIPRMAFRFPDLEALAAAWQRDRAG